MTGFDEKGFDFHGGYLTYLTEGKREFIARFKYDRGAAGPFKTFLKRNFAVDEYLSMLKTGITPMKALESKGYVAPHIKKMCKQWGVEASHKNYLELLKARYLKKV